MSFRTRGYNWEQTDYIEAPTGGWNPTANAWALAANQAQTLNNFLIRPGKIEMRRPIFQRVRYASIADPFLPAGGVVVDGQASNDRDGLVIVGRKVNSTTARVDPWNAPLIQDSIGATLAAGVTTIYQCSLAGNVVTASAATDADHVIGPRWINFDGLMYGIGYDSLGKIADTNNNYAMKSLKLMTLPMTQTRGTVTLPTTLPNAPQGAFDLKGHLGRLWLLGGSDVAGGTGTVHEPTTLFYTIPGTSGIGTALADWRDPTAGTSNKLKMDNDTRDYGVGLAVAGSTLIIFRRASIWALRGTTSSTFTLVPISREVGCVDARSIVETDHGVYFLSRRGLMLTDGSAVRNVTGVMTEVLVPAIQKEQQVLTGSQSLFGTGWASMAQTTLGNLVISIGIHDSNGPGGTEELLPTLSVHYDVGSNAWSGLTSGVWNAETAGQPMAYPFIYRPGRGQLFTLGDRGIVQLENFSGQLSTQAPSFESQAGFGHIGLVDTDVLGNAYSIPALWETRLVPLGTSRRRRTVLKRVFMDYNFAKSQSDGASNNGVGWALSALDAGFTTLIAASNTSVFNSRSGLNYAVRFNPLIQRLNVDSAATRSEVTDMFFSVTSGFALTSGTYSQDGIAEIYGIGLEFSEGPDVVTNPG